MHFMAFFFSLPLPSIVKWSYTGLMVHLDMVKLGESMGDGIGRRYDLGFGTLASASQISHLIPPHDVSLRKSPDQSKCTARQWQVTEPRGALLTEQIPA